MAAVLHAREFRVLSWNVHDLLGNPVALTRVLRGAQPDVVCLQEGPRWPGSRQRLASLARSAGLFYLAGGRRSAGTAVLVSVRAQATGARAWPLPVVGWRTRPRGFVRALVGLPGSIAVSVTCLHLGLQEHERAAHVAELLCGLEPTGPPVVLAGDLNELPDGPSWRTLATRARDPGAVAPATFRAAAPRARIDAVLVDPRVEVLSYGFPDGVDEADVVAASDHRPVLAVLALPPARPALSGQSAADGASEGDFRGKVPGGGGAVSAPGRAPARPPAAPGTGRCR